MYSPDPSTPLNVVIELLQILFIKLTTKYTKMLSERISETFQNKRFQKFQDVLNSLLTPHPCYDNRFRMSISARHIHMSIKERVPEYRALR